MQSIGKIKEDIIQVKLEISKYKELSSNKPTNWRRGRDMYDPELVEERDAFFKVTKIIDEKLKSNNIIMNQLNSGNIQNDEMLKLLETDNHDLVEFVMNFYK